MGWVHGKGSAKAPFPGLDKVVSIKWLMALSGVFGAGTPTKSMGAPATVRDCSGGEPDPLEHLGSASAPVDSAKALRAPPRPRRYSSGSLLAGADHAAVGTVGVPVFPDSG